MKLVLAAALAGAPLTVAMQNKMEPAINSKIPKNWKNSGAVNPTEQLTLNIALKHSAASISNLEAALLSVSTPASQDYGRHLSREDIMSLLDLPAATTKKVVDYFSEYGNCTTNSYGDIISLEIHASSAETVFHTQLSFFTHTDSSKSIIRSTEPYFLDASISQFVNLVDGFHRFPTVRASVINELTPSSSASDSEFNSCSNVGEVDGCKDLTTPDVVRKAYSIPSFSSGNFSLNEQSRMAVAEFQNVMYNPTDLELFSQGCKVSPEVQTAADIGPDKNDPQVCIESAYSCVEAALDIEYIKAVAPEIPLDVWYSDDDDLLAYITSINDDPTPAPVHSVSYGNDEIEQVSEEFMQSVNVEFMKAGVRGVSILVASGDQGVWGRSGCKEKKFHPDFPASSPYVTAVGGTDFVAPGKIGEEKSWDDSGGGFSDVFEIPEWQAAAVAGYKEIAKVLPSADVYSDTGRGYPDISALAGNVNAYCVANGGRFFGIGGTSAATPVIAGIIALLNNERLNAGGAVLGFLNPWLYSEANRESFNDVVVGSNGGEGCFYKDAAGFTCEIGWDPATGLGTPNYEKLLAAL